jgi:farnesyl diphosphate synthase
MLIREVMSFERRLAEVAGAVERQLQAWLAADASTNARHRHPAPARLQAAVHHAVFGGGKRLRPFLVVEGCRLFDVETEAALATAAALECVHCYSLAHDDLPAMDDDQIRRGRPTVWKAFDEWTAILAGDTLLTLAFELLASFPGATRPDVRIRLIQELGGAAGAHGMTGGQCLDLEADKLGEPAAPSLAHILRLQEMKTGALMGFACQAGAILGAAPRDEEQALACFGRTLGLAFQIADDLLDAEGDPAVVGKATGKDASRRKATLVTLLGAEGARAKLRELESEAVTLLDVYGKRGNGLRDAVRFAVRRQM